MRLISPLPINNLMTHDILMLETRFPVVVIWYTIKTRIVGINISITGNRLQAFALNSCNIETI